MGITTEVNTVQWGAVDSKSVALSTVENADDYTFDVTCVQAVIQLKVDNAGTPADGDTVDFYASLKGDPDNDASDEYDTVGNFLTTLDTYATSGGTDPCVKSMAFYPLPGQIYRFIADNQSAASAMTVSMQITEMKVA